MVWAAAVDGEPGVRHRDIAARARCRAGARSRRPARLTWLLDAALQDSAGLTRARRLRRRVHRPPRRSASGSFRSSRRQRCWTMGTCAVVTPRSRPPPTWPTSSARSTPPTARHARTTTWRPPNRSSRWCSDTRVTRRARPDPDTRRAHAAAGPLGAGAVLVQGRQGRRPHDQRAVGDGGDEARVPPGAELAALPDPGRRLVRVAARARSTSSPTTRTTSTAARWPWPGCGSTGSPRTTRRTSTRTGWSPRPC